MRKSTELESLAVLEEVAPRGVITCGDTPVVILRRGSAGNDATCEDPATPTDDIEAWARHALAANGLHQVALTRRSLLLGDLIVAAFRAAIALARRAYARHGQRRRARATYDALRQLDDRMLHDLGFDRSEMTSVASEVTGEAERTRVHALLTSHGFPK